MAKSQPRGELAQARAGDPVGTGERSGDRAVRWIYSAPNIVGAALALTVTGLFLTGVISGVLVPALIVGAYVLGAVATPRPRGLHAGGAYVGGLDPGEVRKELREIEREAASRLPQELAAKVSSIHATIDEMLPLIASSAVDPAQLFAVERTVSDYLPSALDAFLRLPRTYATSHAVAKGKTPADLLGEQLDLIDDKMREISIAIAGDDVGRLLAQGRFLEERFGRGDRALELPVAGNAEQAAGSSSHSA